MTFDPMLSGIPTGPDAAHGLAGITDDGPVFGLTGIDVLPPDDGSTSGTWSAESPVEWIGRAVHGPHVLVPGDTIFGGSSGGQFVGTIGDDRFNGGIGNDKFSGGDGNDVIYGGVKRDILKGDAGNDSAYGGVGNDSIFGNDGDDSLRGQEGNDMLFGGRGNDIISGDEHQDTLYGGQGIDTLEGERGYDTFAFLSVNEGVDFIRDFNGFEGDALDLSTIFDATGAVVTATNFAEHVQITVAGKGSDCYVAVDADGALNGADFTIIARLNNVTTAELVFGNDFVF